jgi:hypothetical protein
MIIDGGVKILAEAPFASAFETRSDFIVNAVGRRIRWMIGDFGLRPWTRTTTRCTMAAFR